MTRINCGVRASELNRQHLLAEHREIKRIPNQISSGRYNLEDIPIKFKLGKGHVKFFYNKLLYLLNRYEEIYKECKSRGFNVEYYGNAWKDLPLELMNDYTETTQDRIIVLARIKERLNNK